MKDFSFMVGGWLVCVIFMHKSRTDGVRNWGINVTVAPRLVEE